MAVVTVSRGTKNRLPIKPSVWREDPEVELMLRVQADEPGALAQLVKQYWSLIYGRCYRQIGDRQEAEDLAQEVFMRLFRHRKRYEPRARFSTWLYHITQNALRNARRARMRHPVHPLPMQRGLHNDEQSADQSLFDHGEDPSQPLERAELVRSIRAAVCDLGRRQRQALELHQFHDQTYAEIAAKMRMTPKAAKSLLYRARSQLRARLLDVFQSE